MSSIIGVLSGKGGVGKTSLVANLGAAITDEFKRDVVIVDANLASSHLGLHLGMYEDLPVTMREVVKRNASVDHALHVHPATGIRIVPAPLSGDGVDMTPRKFAEMTRGLAKEHDIVIVDCPPGLGNEVVTAVSAIDSAIVITTPDFPAVADALKTVRLLERMRKRVIGLVVNKKKGERYELTSQEIESTCGVPVVATIPEDVRVSEGVSEGIPVVLLFPYTKSSSAFKCLAGRLVGEEYRPMGIFGRICGAFSRRRSYPAAFSRSDIMDRVRSAAVPGDAPRNHSKAAPRHRKARAGGGGEAAEAPASDVYGKIREEVVRKARAKGGPDGGS